MIRAPGIFRSVTFWSGILVMTFICWAWWDSSRNGCYIRVGPVGLSQSYSHISVIHTPGKSEIATDRYKMDGTVFGFLPLPPPFVVRGDPLPPAGPSVAPESFKALVERNWVHAPRDNWLLCIPHWLILFAAAVAWSGLLYWRARRRGSFRMP